MTAAARAGDGGASTDLVRLYLSDIGRYPLLTKAQEVELAQAIDLGRTARERLAQIEEHVDAAEMARLAEEVRRGERATTAFVQANLRLVVSVARKYQSAGLAMMDLVQDGNLGLIRAVEKFDWQRGFKFSTYATWWIRQAITRGVSDTSRSIRLPTHVADLVHHAYRVRFETFEQHGRTVTTAELARELELSESYLTSVLAAAGSPRSLSESFGDNNDLELADRLGDANAISPSDAAVDGALPADLDAILSCLDDRERNVLRLRFGLDRGEPRTLEEVGLYFRLTRERIRQIEQSALAKLRQPAMAPRVRELLDS